MPRSHEQPPPLPGRVRNPPDRWRLDDVLFRPVEAFDDLIKELDREVARLERLRNRLAPDMKASTFLQAIHHEESIRRRFAKLNAYAHLWFSEDTGNQRARAFESRVRDHLTRYANRLLFFHLWWQQIDDANAARLMNAAGNVRYYLENIRRFKDHTLSEAEEKIINLKNSTGSDGLETLYDILTNGLTFHLRVEGRTRTLSREELTAYFRHPDKRLRERAYQELYRVYTANRDMIGEIYKTLVQDWRNENLSLRNYVHPMAVRNLSNDVPDEAVDTLLRVCRRNADVFQEYFKIKAGILKLKPMSRYHIYAPQKAAPAQYRYPDAVSKVLEAYHSFSPRMAEMASRVFKDRHIDARVRPGKMGGAYCYSVLPDLTPYVLLNYTGEARDVATLAHELGHAIHAMMAGDRSILTFHATLPLAETASVFGERLLSDALLQQETNASIKRSLLLAQLDDIYATVMRQAYFVQFERQAHDMVANAATVDDLAGTYLHDLRRQFGRAVQVPDEFKWEWLTIPHIFSSPFYCYAYSFGNLLVLALYQQYNARGTSFVPQYLKLLAAGGSQSPESVLSSIGIDIRSEAFWQSGFDTIRELVTQLERTAA